MSARFEELDWRRTQMGEISLRRRRYPTVDKDVYEVKLDDEFLMSSLFTTAERELARRALAELDRARLRVLVGGLGLGYTAHAALADPRVTELTVVEAAEPVLDWHHRRLLPDTQGLASDPRCRLVHDDFFRLVRSDVGIRYDAILLDIDHTPRHVLHPSHADFYSVPGLTDLTRHLSESGVFALWSDDPPDDDFQKTLAQVFSRASAHVITFANPLTRGESSSTVYLAHRVAATAS
ncbi:MAG: spermidine synthase [Propionibacteriales bacterium]|nr:spermidine synthase [Propionibacteriales bacterium]